jgi:hypothetical protein
MMQNSIENVRFKLLVPYICSLFIIVFAGLWSLNYYQQQQDVSFAEEMSDEIKNTFDHSVLHDVDLMKSIGFFISRNDYLKQAWLNKDRQSLLNIGTPIFEK